MLRNYLSAYASLTNQNQIQLSPSRFYIIFVVAIIMLSVFGWIGYRVFPESAPVARGAEYAQVRSCVNCHGDTGQGEGYHPHPNLLPSREKGLLERYLTKAPALILTDKGRHLRGGGH